MADHAEAAPARPRPWLPTALVAGVMALVVASVAIAAAMTFGDDDTSTTRREPVNRVCPIHSDATAFAVSGKAEVGQAVPEFTGISVDDCALSRADYAGRPLVIAFGASWCEPCRTEWPIIADELDARPGQFAVLAVAFKDLAIDTRPFLDEIGVPWQAIRDPDGAIARAYRVPYVPTTFFVSADGVLRERFFNAGRTEIHDALNRLLADSDG